MKAYIWPADGRPPPTTSRQRWGRFVERYLPSLVLYLMVATLLSVVLVPHMVLTVPSGQVGVLWKRFAGGTVLDPRELRDEGLHVIFPWDRLFLYDLRVQSITETYNAISSDGVTLNATLNIRFRLQHDSVPTLHQVVGPNYIKLLGPQIASQMREVIAQYTAEQVYSTARQEIQEKIRELALEKLSHKMMERESDRASYNVAMRDTIILYDTLLYGIELPALVVHAINRKTEQYYISEEYKFRVERERRESERKKIEAEGIREFQQIVSQGISDSYLRWRGVEATLQLAQSNNSKVVVIGNPKDGLPLILGNMDSAPPVQARGEPPPAEDGVAPKERMTAAAPAMPLERMPAAGLAMPAERMPAAPQGPRPHGPTTDAAPGTPATAPGASRSVLPFSLSDLQAILARVLGGEEKPEPAAPDAWGGQGAGAGHGTPSAWGGQGAPGPGGGQGAGAGQGAPNAKPTPERSPTEPPR
jgi:regulator of protease activity HflC (stomatin/prohibitin superfamily)